MKVMTYNILNDNPRFKKVPKKYWPNRRPHVLQLIQAHQPDVLAIQEGKQHQVEEIQAVLKNHAYYGPSSKAKGGEKTGIYYNKKLFELVYSETFWLSRTPEKESIDWDAGHIRICSFVQLKSIASSQIFFLFNTHLDSKSAVARQEGIKVIIRKINQLQQQHPRAHFILTGDFNAHPKTRTYRELIEHSPLKDCFAAALTHKNDLNYSFTGMDKNWSKDRILLHLFYPNYMHKRLDHVFVSPNLNVLNYEISNWSYNGKYYPSDHLPIIVELEAGS